MAGIGFLLGGAIANALAFTGSSYLFSHISKNNIDKERKRHDLAIEKLEKAQVEWSEKRQKRIDFINNRLLKEKKAEQKFNELGEAMREYHQVFGEQLKPLERKPVLSDFYTPSDDQHYRELTFITLGMASIRAVLYYIEKH